jgi:hypothetical protein
MIGQFRPQPIAVTPMASRPMRLDRSWASGEAIAGAWQQQATPSKGVQTICLSEALRLKPSGLRRMCCRSQRELGVQSRIVMVHHRS